MCDWLPELYLLESYRGDWDAFLDAVYGRYCADLVRRRAQFDGREVNTKRHPEVRGKGSGFWHCISERADSGQEEDRPPDISRCERIAWIRAVIEQHPDMDIQYWQNQRHGRGLEINHLLWFNREYLVILSERENKSENKRYLLLKTAYTTTWYRRIEDLQEECDRWNSP